MKHWFLILPILFFTTVSFAQKTQKVTASYTYYAPENVTLEEAKRTALDRAKISAIADAFGTLVTQSNSTVMTNQNGQTDSRFFSLGGSEVKGEWIETIKEPEYKISYEVDMLIVSVTVSGRIREITSAGIDIVAKVLRNGTEEKFESSEFRSGDDMYLYFQSPVDGYLTVYLLDETTQEVFCLLPYRASGEGAYKIDKNGDVTRIHTSDKTKDLIALKSHFHTREDDLAWIEKHSDVIKDTLVSGSTKKGCLIASGVADVLYRTTHNTKEWDTCAIDIIVREAGGTFTDLSGKEIVYNREDVYNRNGYVICNNKENFISLVLGEKI